MFCTERRHMMFPLCRGMLSQLTRCTSVQNLGCAKHCDKSKRRRKKINVGRWTQTITGGRVGHRFWLFLLCEGNACNTTDIVFRLVVKKSNVKSQHFLEGANDKFRTFFTPLRDQVSFEHNVQHLLKVCDSN